MLCRFPFVDLFVRRGPKAGKRVSKGDELIRKERCKDSLIYVARASHKWDKTWVYADADSIIASESEIPTIEDLLVIVLDGTLDIRPTVQLLAGELGILQ